MFPQPCKFYIPVPTGTRGSQASGRSTSALRSLTSGKEGIEPDHSDLVCIYSAPFPQEKVCDIPVILQDSIPMPPSLETAPNSVINHWFVHLSKTFSHLATFSPIDSSMCSLLAHMFVCFFVCLFTFKNDVP